MEVLFFVFFVITWGLQAWILIEGSESFQDLRERVQDLRTKLWSFEMRADAAQIRFDELKAHLGKPPAPRLGTPQELREILSLRAELADAQDEERYWRDELADCERDLADVKNAQKKRDRTTEQARTWAIEDLLRKGLSVEETVRELRVIDNEHGFGVWK